MGWVRESPSPDTAPVLLLLLLVLLQFDTLSERGHCCIRGPRSIPQRAPSERASERADLQRPCSRLLCGRWRSSASVLGLLDLVRGKGGGASDVGEGRAIGRSARAARGGWTRRARGDDAGAADWLVPWGHRLPGSGSGSEPALGCNSPDTGRSSSRRPGHTTTPTPCMQLAGTPAFLVYWKEEHSNHARNKHGQPGCQTGPALG